MPSLPPFDAGQPWFRLLDDRAQAPVATPQRRYRPNSLADLIAIVRDAEATADSTLELRAAGSHWALSTASVTQRYVIETADPNAVTAGDPDVKNQPWLNKTLYDVIPKCLSRLGLRFFIGQDVASPFDPTVMPDHTKFYLYHVEAGTRIWELYSRLDAGVDPGSLDSDLAKYAGPWAMQTLGGAGGQTIAGAFSTGTHGGDVHLAPIADAVQAIHLVGPEGKQYWFEQPLPNGAPVVDDDKLRALYGPLGEIEIVRDPDRFHAVLVAAGRMGIIYSVVLRVVRQYGLHELQTAVDSWTSVKSWIGNPLAPTFVSNRFVQVLINPNPKLKITDDHTCYVTVRTLEALEPPGTPPGTTPRGRKERGQKPNAGNSIPLADGTGSFYDTICASDSPARAAIALLIAEATTARDDALTEVAKYTALLAFLPNPYFESMIAENVLIASTAEALSILLAEFLTSLPTGPLGKSMGLICVWAAQTDHMEIFRRIAEAALAVAAGKDLHAISYSVLDIHNYLDVGCSANGDSLEVFFDAASPNLVVFIERIFQRMKELENGWLTGTRLAFAGYVAIRFMSQSAALLAMQQFPQTCSLEIAGYLDVPGTVPFLTRIEQDAVDLGATIHWGQRNDLTMKQVEQMYDPTAPTGHLFRWRKALAAITDNGRLALFSTPFTRVRGLEVVQPIIQDFTVSPTNGCAGAPVTISWAASANPPGTAASLEVTRTGSTGPPADTIQLAALDGTQDVALPAGASDFTLVVTTTLNGRTREDRRTIEVRGFSDHEVWKILRSGTCLSVDGQMRWGVEVSFAGTVAPTLVVEGLYCNFTSASTWTVRRTGMSDVLFSAATSVQMLPTRPALQGTWLFFVDALGCGGGPPLFAVEFQLVCGQ